jgi:signal transduction histidine kinase
MNQLTRIGSSLALLLVLLLAALAMNTWLHGQSRNQIRQLNESAVSAKQAQFADQVARMDWTTGASPALLAELGQALGATVTLESAAGAAPGAALLGFVAEVPDKPSGKTRVNVTFPAPAAARLIASYHRVTLVLLFLCPVLFTVGFIIAILARRRPVEERGSRSPWAQERKQALGIEHFAKISNERTVALAQEQDARQRAEEDLQLNRALLGNSVAERVRLGRELHDNLSQTLYAVCLTLESVQKKGALKGELEARVNHCMVELKRLNQEVRAYLRELEPAQVTASSFATALNDLIQSVATGQEVQIEQRLDDEALAAIPPMHIAEIMNILREAVSNSVRHGRARRIALLAGRSEQTVALAVHDDGDGFNPAAAGTGGHGLGNMRARAAAIGATLRIESTPGKGTRVLLTLPVPSSP